VDEKQRLRGELRIQRREHVAALPPAMRGLVFLRPPGPVVELMPEGATIGLYHAIGSEAPTAAYARWFWENGRQIALPWFADRTAPMEFRLWDNPFADDLLEPDPFGAHQPLGSADPVIPDAVFLPLLGFTAEGHRLGQGQGHYDRWLAANPAVLAIGLGWDCQLRERLPLEPHDQPLAGIVTPTRFYATRFDEGHR